ncbi:cytochrome c biogenesis protein CcdA [Salinisphaera hydrothermalis]|uniref:cytochrome c biogenesis protein CcdA n=1 Tax=Salinisphaera hydrothermalis TaxID=563188 RepID=UPI00333EB4B2
MDLAPTLVLAAGLGLLGFVEPCSVGSHLLFLKFLDRLPERRRVLQTLVFAVVRAALMAGLGILAAVIGARFLGIQQALWAALGSAYIMLGLVYLAGGAPWMIRQTHRLLPQVTTSTGSITLGAVFGLNIPACAGPLLAVLLGGAAAQAAAGGGVIYGASTLLVFGLALSSPLVLAVFTERGRRILNAIARLAARMPRVTGAVLVLLGLWSISLAFF